MNTPSLPSSRDGITLRQAAIVAGVTYLTNPVSYAEFSIYPRLVVTHNIEATVQNLNSHPGLFITAILCNLINFIGDMVLAWALYHLLAPVNKALSLLASWFQLIYAGMGLCGVFNLIAVRNLLDSPDYLGAFGPTQLHAQILYLLRAFHNDFDFALVLFGVHLALVGYLITRCSYIPRVLGYVLIVNGLGYVVGTLGPYIRPTASFDFIFITYLGEIAFMLWLLIRGWKIPQLEAASAAAYCTKTM